MMAVCFRNICFSLLLLVFFTPAYAAQILVLHTHFVPNLKFEKLEALAQQQQIQLQHYTVGEKTDGLEQAIQQADLIVLDTPRPADRQVVEQAALPLLQHLQKDYLGVGGGPAMVSGIEPALGQRLVELYSHGGAINFSQFFKSFQSWHGKQHVVLPEVQQLPDIAIYHPQAPQYFDQPAQYLQWYQQHISAQSASHAVFIVHPSTVTDLTTDKIDQLIQYAEQKHVMPLVILWNEVKAKQSLADFLADTPVDALVNMTHIQKGQQLIDSLAKLNVPMIQTMRYSQGDEQQWHKATSGISPSLAATFLAVPESWGFSDPLVLSVQENGQDVWLKPQLDLLLDKINAQAQLRHLDHAEKHIALMYWNYPNGANNLSASNLNIPQSILNIQQALTEQGYEVPKLSEQQIIQQAQTLLSVFYDHQKLSDLQQQNLIAYYPVKDYLDWRSTLPESRQQQLPSGEQLYRHWAVVKKGQDFFFAIPCWRAGHLSILPQPPRSTKLGENYHSLQSVPDVLYLATYLYLQQSQQALIHLGTHGTQEWLPGKDRGLDSTDYPYLTAGSLPIFYPYVQDNIAEALQAKRRGRAITISHQTAPLAPSGLYDELRDIHETIHQYIQLDEGVVKQQTQKKLIELVHKSGIDKDIGATPTQINQDFPHFFEQLHDRLHKLAQKNVPLGLHHFGQSATDEQRLIVVMQQLGRGYFEALQQDYDEILTMDASDLPHTVAYRWLAFQVLGQADKEVAALPLTLTLEQYRTQAKQNFANLAAGQEIQSLLNGLQGGFVLPGTGGDPIRQPDSVSGRNLYAFEASKVPSESAYQTAEKTFGQLLQHYQQQHSGQFPKKIAFSLWSSETIRHFGVTEAQILQAIGAKPVWDSAGRVTSLEIIPREQLSHPRIDVVIQATSVYRDQFDQFMRLLAHTLTQISELDEPDNLLYLHARQLQQELIRQQIPVEQAKTLSSLKIFSNQPGDYGSGLSKQTLSYDQWDNDQQLAHTFLNNLQYAYGEKTWGESSSVNLFAENLKQVDVALMSRSSNVQGVLSTDHPFEYLGGLSMAIRQVRGQSPELLITDLRQNTSEMTSLKQFLSDEMRTRYLSPQWIKSMQKEGYAGTLEVLNATNNLYGWNVADPDVVRNDQWQDLYDTYVRDKRHLGVNQWFAAHNPQAQLQLLTRMAEAIRQDYWQADQQTRQKLAQTIKRLQKNPELKMESQRVQQFVEQQLSAPTQQMQAEQNTTLSSLSHPGKSVPAHPTASPHQVTADHKDDAQSPVPRGQGLAAKTASAQPPAPPVSTPPASTSTPQARQKIQGQTLALVPSQKNHPHPDRTGIWVILGLIGTGMAWQYFHMRKSFNNH